MKSEDTTIRGFCKHCALVMCKFHKLSKYTRGDEYSQIQRIHKQLYPRIYFLRNLYILADPS